MKILILILLMVTGATAQTFTDCRVGQRQYDSIWKQDSTIIQCTNETGKAVALAFPIDRYAFGSQCAVTASELQNRRPEAVYDDPFTLRFHDGKWQKVELSTVCEMWLTGELPICEDHHGHKEPGKPWDAANLFHGQQPCRP